MSGPINTTKEGGFIALITAILISISLLIIVIAVSFQGFAGRFAILESELKEESDFLAEACVQTARLKLLQDNSYTGDETITVGNKTCRIVDVDNTPLSNATIQVSASSSDAYTNLEVIVDASAPPTVFIKSWEEVPSF